MEKLYFASDYQEGAHPQILRRLSETNRTHRPGYGTDEVCASAREKIRDAADCPKAAVHFLAGGTQANRVVIDALLRPWQGVIAADSGHIALHEAGAIEAGGHKVLTLPNTDGKITDEQIRELLETFAADENRDHMVEPGMVYLSQPTEYGTLYSHLELAQIAELCDAWKIPLYVDGARLAYALACPENDVMLPDLAALCDVFYIGGTKCGALLGEAVVVPDPDRIPHFFTMIKQHGALLAKGWVAGMQFDELFTDLPGSMMLYLENAKTAIAAADRIRGALSEYGYVTLFGSPTNQIFVHMEDAQLARLAEQVEYSFWEKTDADHTIIRLATSWATTDADVDALCALLKEIGQA